ncbi:MAG: 5-oxoprolinase [Gammaproteobacteria bacterium SG8_11]|nr:MAG: 5-oxoprolinase [Gammaproteobacteria bacterium SG8_11]
MNAIELSLFSSRMEAVCDEMGAVLRRAAFSPNIKDRLDFSCAVFDAQGALCAQAAHIPVHIGSMAFAMRDVINKIQWQPGDMVILNDPFMGGTHLPDVTVIAPLYDENSNQQILGFVVNRAHHADIGAATPGSMPISRSLHEEGMIISPTRLLRKGKVITKVMESLTGQTLNAQQTLGDFTAQISANRAGLQRLRDIVNALGVEQYCRGLQELNDYAERLAAVALNAIPDGEYRFQDYMDDDGLDHTNLGLQVALHVHGHYIEVDFTGTAAQTPGNINCPLSVAAAGVYYVFRCLMPSYTPNCEGAFRSIRLTAPKGCLLNAEFPAAVAAGNVETSTRVVDVVMGALAKAIPNLIPAASHGSMNNLAMGARTHVHGHDRQWDYYETIGGGMGAGPTNQGLSAVQTHMTNTLNTPLEVIELNYPLRVTRYAVRHGSGGQGKHKGGDGIVREFGFLQAATVTLLTERRSNPPWGLNGGEPGARGENCLNGQPLPGKKSLHVKAGDKLTIKTPGGGGWGV